MTQQDASSETDDNHINSKPVKFKAKNGHYDQSAAAKKPRHSEIEQNNHKWKCPICQVGFSSFSELNAHVGKAHGEKQWKCEYCGKSYGLKGNLVRHVRLKHSLIQYQCMHCRITVDTFDLAVYHAQGHLVRDASKENVTQINQALDNNRKSVTNNALITIKFDYRTLLKGAWFGMIPDLSIPLKTEAASLYKYTRCVKLNWDSRRRNKKRCVLLYQCGMCKLIVHPAKVEEHCKVNCKATSHLLGFKCPKCPLSFLSRKALRRHKKRHEKNQCPMVKIATFNSKEDVHFNNTLRSLDTDEDTEVEEISNPGTPENSLHGTDEDAELKEISNPGAPDVSDSEKIENGSKSSVAVWDSDNDSDNGNPQSPPQLNKSFGGVFTKKDEIIQKSNDTNSVENINHDKVAKRVIVEKNSQNDQSAFKRRRISEENPRGRLEADKSQPTEDEEALEDTVESVHGRYNLEENEDSDQNVRENQQSSTTANIGAEHVSVEPVLASEYVSLNNMAILHGSFNQDDERFESSRGKQCTAIAAVACAAFCVLDPNTWTRCVIDNIVVIGDKYYNDCISNRRLPAAGEVNPEYLTLRDLMPRIIFHELILLIAFDEETNLNGHIDNDIGSFHNLRKSLEIFFRTHVAGILTSNAMSVSVAKTVGERETYWLFDSHSRGPEGGLALGGAACCMKFSHLDDLHDLLRRNLYKSPSEVPKGHDLIDNVFSLTSLRFINNNGNLS